MRRVKRYYLRGDELTVILAIATGLAAGGVWVAARRAPSFWAVAVQVAVLAAFVAMFSVTYSAPPSDNFRIVAGGFTGVAVAIVVTSVSDLRKLRARRSLPD